MNQDYSTYPGTDRNENEELAAPPSRFIDEKISEESCVETQSDSAMKPAGLSNPFWK